MAADGRLILLGLLILLIGSGAGAYQGDIQSLTKHRDQPCTSVSWDEDSDSFGDLSGCKSTWHPHVPGFNTDQPTPVGYVDFADAPEYADYAHAPECVEFDYRWQTYRNGKVVYEDGWNTLSACASDDPTLSAFSGWYLWQEDGVSPDAKSEMGSYTMQLSVRGANGFQESVSWTFQFADTDFDGDGILYTDDPCVTNEPAVEGTIWPQYRGCPDVDITNGVFIAESSRDGKTVTFSAQSVVDGTDCTVEYSDGTSRSLTFTKDDAEVHESFIPNLLGVMYERKITHTFDSWGSHTATLTCSDDDGNTGSDTVDITLTEPAPKCTPKSEACDSVSCGTVSNGCGGTYNCGTCDTGPTCGNGVCESGESPESCSADCGQPDSDGDGTPDGSDACPHDASADTDSDGDGYCDANEACDSDGGRYPGNYNSAYCSDQYRWVCGDSDTRVQQQKNRWAPRCGSGCRSGSWERHTSQSPPSSQYACRDTDGTGGSDAEWVDVVPPTTTDSSDNQWHRRDVIVRFTCRDQPDGSGCARTEYCIDQSNTCTPSQTGSATVSTEGVNYVRYRSTDNAGNTEPVQSTTVLIDRTPPSVTCNDCIDPETSAKGEPVTITPSTTDDQAGLSSTTVCSDRSCTQILCGSPPCEYAASTVSRVPVWVRATDQVGNTNTVKIGEISFRLPIGALCTSDDACVSGRCEQRQCVPKNVPPLITFD